MTTPSNFTSATTEVSTKWQTSYWFGAPGAHADTGSEVYIDKNFVLSDGSTIDPLSDSVSGTLKMRSGAFPAGVTAPGYATKPYYGAVATTFGSFRFDWGYVEIRCKNPPGGGAWPGQIMYAYSDYLDYKNGVSTATQEVDFSENSGGQPNYSFTTLRDVENANFSHTYSYQFADGTAIPDLTADFHTYGFNFSPSGVTTWIDNKPVIAAPGMPVSPGLWRIWFLSLALDVDNAAPNTVWYQNPPDAATYPKTWEIDYVRVFRTSDTTLIDGPAAKIQMKPTKPKLGFYDGYVGSNLAGQLATMTSTLGKAPVIVNIGVDQTQAMSSWVAGATGAVGYLVASATGLIPAFTVPMASVADGDTPATAFAAISNGSRDGVYSGIFSAIAAHCPTGYLRLGWEPNTTDQGWKANNSADAAAYAAAFQHLVALARPILGAGWQMVWNMSQVYEQAIDTTLCYPGDAAVDLIGHDIYSDLYPFGGSHTWQGEYQTLQTMHAGPSQWDWTLARAIQFARLHGKKWALCEAGAGSTGAAVAGITPPRDDPNFWPYIGTKFNFGDCEYMTFWNGDPGRYDVTTGAEPNALAAVQALIASVF